MSPALEIRQEAVNKISADIAKKFRVVSFDFTQSEVSVYYDTEGLNSTNQLEVFTGLRFTYHKLETSQLDELLNTYYGLHTKNAVKKIVRTSSTVLSEIISDTLELGGSDIHFEPYENDARIRIRLDGHLVERYQIEQSVYAELINQVKVESKLDIAEKRVPQDGRINFKSASQEVDIRVNSLPTMYGEKVVLRLLGKSADHLSLDGLGFQPSELSLLRDLLRKPNGMILISGPTGSGKTTTLYSTLRELNHQGVNILTIEDPIEYTLQGINQVQLNEKVGLSFGAAMRSFLRQDPDIIMVGEIRDQDTAMMATRAALTGHLVFSTVHTNSAAGIINRLLELGVDPFILSETLNAGIAQRLIRKLCVHCKVPTKNNSVCEQLGVDPNTVFDSVGCSKCLGLGYSGRVAIYEIIPGTLDLTEVAKLDPNQYENYMTEKSLPTLKKSAIRYFSEGVTSYNEILPYIY